jgi:murein L,D-transpeptidase YafK
VIEPRRFIVACALALVSAAAFADNLEPPLKADRVRVVKSELKLYLLRDDEVLATYPIALGGAPVGHKVREGDQRTPEGWYLLDFKNEASSFHRSIHISYPNAEDVYWARQRGVDPGSNIMIHGQSNGSPNGTTRRGNWTDGCIALSNAHMDQVWAAIDLDTPIEIFP